MKSREYNPKKILLIVVIVLVVSFGIAMGISMQKHKVTLDNVSKVCYNNGNIVAVDLTDDSTNIVSFNTKGVQLGMVSYPLSSGSTYSYVSELLNYDGNVYAHILGLDSTNGLVQSDRVALCNFNDESLETKWNISFSGDTFESVALCTAIVNDNLYYITIEDSIATLNVLESTGVSSVIYSAKLPTCDFATWYITDSLTMVGCSSYGGVYILDSTTTSKVYPLSNSVSSLVDFTLYEDTLHFTDLDTNQSITYSIATKSIEYSNMLTYSNVDITSLEELQYIGNDTYLALCKSISGSDRIAIGSNRRVQYIDNVTYSFSPSNIAFIKYLVLCCLVLLVLVFLIGWYIHSERCVVIWVKVMAIFIVVFVITMPIISYNIESKLTENLIEDSYDSALIDLENIVYDYDLDYLMLSDSEEFQPPTQSIYDTLKDCLYSETITDIQGRDSRSSNVLKPQCYAFHVLDQDGNLVTLKSYTTYDNTPTAYLYDSSIVDCYVDVLNSLTDEEEDFENSYKYVKTINRTPLGDYYALAYVKGNAILEVGFEKYLVESEVNTYMHHFRSMVGAILVGMFLVFIVVLMLSLRPISVLLKRIKSNYYKSDSKVSRKVSTNEIVEINSVFEGMMVSIQKSQLEMEKNNQTYSQFAPSEILRMVYDNYDILKSKANDSRQKMLYSMQIGLTSLPKDTFNTSLDTIIYTIKEHHGIIEYFNLDYVEVFFEDSPKEILRTSMELLQRLDGISIALSYGVSIPAILGANNRLEAVVVSQQKKVLERLEGISNRYGLRLLVSDSFYEKLSSPTDFQMFLVGNVRVGREYINFYSVVDATTQELSYIKEDFENGVKSFLNCDFLNAKNSFVNVLRYNSNNSIAKEYLKMCETYAIDGSNVNTDIL